MTITNLAELLSESQSDYVIYDLGRRVQAIDAATFQAICNQQRPYPYPLQDHAWFAVVFWPQLSEAQPEPFLWFLKIPVDERGLLNHAAQQEFMAHVIALLGQQITGALDQQQEQQLQQSAYLFTPSEAKRAALHAQLTVRFNKAPSHYYAAAVAELTNPTPQGWQQLGLQGIHDAAARLAEQSQQTQAVAQHFASYAENLQKALAEALEHTTPPSALLQPLLHCLTEQTSTTRLNALRALAGFAKQPDVQADLQALLPNSSMDELVIITARLWPALQGELMQPYLVRIAELNNPALFAGVVRDILRLPDTRIHALGLVQRNDLPAVLYKAWQQFMGRHQ